MAIVLYKSGDKDISRGVKCEVGRFPVSELAHALSLGWRTKPEDTLEDIGAPQVDVTSKGDVTHVDSHEDCPHEEEEALRARAKEAGITNYWNKNIDKLKAELAEL
jgi:hypothetical protein